MKHGRFFYDMGAMAIFGPFPGLSFPIGIIYHLAQEMPLKRKFAEIKFSPVVLSEET